MRISKNLLAAATISIGIAAVAPTDANADLLVGLSGTPGSGETTLTFSGSSVVASGSGAFLEGNFDFGGWFSFGNYVKTINDSFFTLTGGAATLSVNGTPRSIDSTYLDDDGDGLDDWGLSIVGPGDLAFVAGDLISWSGSLAIGVDFAEFNTGNFSTSDFGFGLAQVPIDMTVTLVGPAAVPEPGTSGLVALSLIGLAALRRRKVV
jgi:hypothetical protein